MIAGLEPLGGGTISIGGRVVNHLTPGERNVAMVFEAAALYPHLTAAQNLRFGLAVRKLPAERDRAAGRGRGPGAAAGDASWTASPRPSRPGSASGWPSAGPPSGSRTCSCSTSRSPTWTPASASGCRTELAQLQHGLGVTAIYVTHDQSQAMAIGDRVAVMRGGRIEQLDEPRTLYRRPANAFVASFMGEPAMNLVAGFIEQDAGRTFVVLGGQRLPFPGTPSGLVRGRTRPGHRRASGPST